MQIERMHPLRGFIMKNKMCSAYDLIKSNCEAYRDLDLKTITDCYNSTYVVKDCDGIVHGIIACHRIDPKEYEDTIMGYHPQKYNVAYRIEALHFDMMCTAKDRARLIETCLVDKNDSFVFLEPKCEEVKNNNLLSHLGFEKIEELLVRAPKVYSNKMKRDSI